MRVRTGCPTERRGIVARRPARRSSSPTPSAWRRRASRPAPRRASSPCCPASTTCVPVPLTTGARPARRRPSTPTPSAAAGDDFYALRPYVVGDDLRRVHWPSTARHDELMVRQDELPWQGRTTVCSTCAGPPTTAESLEAAVSAAASIVVGQQRAAATSCGWSPPTAPTRASGRARPHLHALLEHLAVVEATGSASLRTMIDARPARRPGRPRAGRRPDGRRRADRPPPGCASGSGSVSVVRVRQPGAPAAERVAGRRRRRRRVIRVDRRRPVRPRLEPRRSPPSRARPGVARSAAVSAPATTRPPRRPPAGRHRGGAVRGHPGRHRGHAPALRRRVVPRRRCCCRRSWPTSS